jgi:hypothetical protein
MTNNLLFLILFDLDDLKEHFMSYTYIIPLTLIPEGVAEVSQIFLWDTQVLPISLAMRNTADKTGSKPIAVLLQYISGVSAINPLVAFYNIHEGKREVLFFYFVQSLSRYTPTCPESCSLSVFVYILILISCLMKLIIVNFHTHQLSSPN